MFFRNTLNTRPIIEGNLKFIRSDVPQHLDNDEIEWLKKNHITTIVDLRQPDECCRKQCFLVKERGFDYYNFPVSGGNIVPESPDMVSESYFAMVDENMDKIVDFIMSCDKNVLFFCNAGKDRTGVVSAIILHKLGYDDEYIIGDYLKSGNNLMAMLTEYAALNSNIDINVIIPNRRYMAEFLDKYRKRIKR